MAIVYNPYDHVWYGTHAERTAVTLPDGRFPATAKLYEYDTTAVFISNGEIWYPM